MELRTTRLILRPYRPEDAPALYAAKVASMPQLRSWMPWAQTDPTPEGEAETIRHFQRNMDAKEKHGLAIFLHDGTFIGSGGFHYKRPEVPSFELGYWQHSGHCGNGYIHEAVCAQTEELFSNWGANRVMVRCHHLNEASAKVARTAGFEFEGRHRNARRHVDGTLADDLVFAHTPQTWQTFRAKSA